jgi:hypothetical protein
VCSGNFPVEHPNTVLGSAYIVCGGRKTQYCQCICCNVPLHP